MKKWLKLFGSALLCTLLFCLQISRLPALSAAAVNETASKSKSVSLRTPKIKSVKDISAKELEVSWGKVSGAAKYIIYRSAAADGPFKKIKTTAKLAYKDTNLKANTKYYYKIRAYKKKGVLYYSAYSKSKAQRTRATGSFVANTAAAKVTKQIIFVKASGSLAKVSFHEKNLAGVWKQKMSTSGCIGRNGLGKTKEGDAKTPTGTFRLGEAFGIDSNPGTVLPYTKVTASHYWVDDPASIYYNQFVTTDEVTKDWSSAEHLIDYRGVYDYAIAIAYNKNNIPGKGSAVFLHCQRGNSTGGCVAIPKDKMKYILQRIKPGARIVIQ